MDKVQLQLESVKMIKEWSTWLVAIQVAICGFLWNALKANPVLVPADRAVINSPKVLGIGIVLHLAWLSFALSLLVAAFLLLRLPRVIEDLKETSAQSIFSEKTILLGGKISLKMLVGIEYMLFLAGVVLAALFAFTN